MSPRSICTECLVECRSCDVLSFPMCTKHHICKTCMAKRSHRPQNAVGNEKCPICDESRRRLSMTVRSRIWQEENMKLQCVTCDRYATGGALMKCGHSYCLPCLRKQPRSLQSRTVDGHMSKSCQDCEKRAAEEMKEEARAAMERAEWEAQARRDEREDRERREDLQLLGARRKKRTAPAAPAPAAPAPAAPPANSQSGAKPTLKKLSKVVEGKENVYPKSKSEGKKVPSKSRRVSFDPNVQQKTISPREPRKRVSLPPSTSTGLQSSSIGNSMRPSSSQSEAPVPVSMFASVPYRGWGYPFAI